MTGFHIKFAKEMTGFYMELAKKWLVSINIWKKTGFYEEFAMTGTLKWLVFYMKFAKEMSVFCMKFAKEMTDF